MPDGANAERDEQTAGSDQPAQQQPDTVPPADQVDLEIATATVTAEVSDWWRSLFGIGGGQPHEAGGGGTGGQFMFASVDELNAVIKQWQAERDAIVADRDKIAEAYHEINEPAGDGMSTDAAVASRNSLSSMWQHNVQMLQYAEDYISKLQASRDQMQTMEDGAVARMRGIEI